MDYRSESNTGQTEYWNSASGEKWVNFQVELDTVLQSVNDRLLLETGLKSGDRILDIGCGTGATTFDAVQHVGPSGSVLGVDISRPLLDCAATRAKDIPGNNISFLLADAQTYRFKQEHFDSLVSRMGMMFFDDPVAAFRNLAGSLKHGAKMCFACWAGTQFNPWFSIPKSAAETRLGNTTAVDPKAPGPLAFSDIDYVRDLLTDAAIGTISAEKIELELIYPGTVDQAASLACSVGPAVRIVKEFQGDGSDVSWITSETSRCFESFVKLEKLHIPAAFNFFHLTTG